VASQKDIQSLIADIDSILPKAGPRLPWSKPLDIGEFRRILERVRSFLIALQNPPLEALEPRTLSAEAQQIVQEVTQEINLLRAELKEPLQAELADLRQQRDALVKEIQQLESARQPMDSSSQLSRVQQQIVSDFSQRLISHCAESLKQQLRELFLSWEARLASNQATTGAIAPANQGNSSSMMAPQERLEQLQQMQAHSDQLLRTLDTNQRLIFETLQGNLEAYQQSLSQGIAKMYSLGSHGEIMVKTLVDRLTQHVGQEASTALPSSLPLSEEDLLTNPIASSPTTIPDTFPQSETSIPTEEPLPPAEQLFAELENTIFGTKKQEATAQFDPTAPDSFPESPNSEWEILEGLDFEELNVELEETQGRETSQENSPEIDDLYESLFGQESLSSTAELDASESLLTQPAETSPIEADLDTSAPIEETASLAEPTPEQVSNSDSVNASSSSGEDVRLRGISEPADSVNREPRPDSAVTELSQSELLADAAPTSGNTDLAGISQVDASETNWQSPSESARQLEGVERITALTDLFEEMGLTGNTPVPVAESLTTTTKQRVEYPTSENEPQESLMEDQYEIVPPEVDLLPEDELGSRPRREIQFAQNTLQQLSEDLDRFGEPQTPHTPSFAAEEFPGNNRELPSSQPSETQAQQSYLQELLAEDYDEFSPLDWSDEEQASQKAVTTDSSSPGELTETTAEEEISDNLAAMSHESVESDFEPDLFPSEVLKLDRTEGEDLTTPLEEIALDDESFMEMSSQEGSSNSTQELPQAEFLNSEQPDQKTDNSDSEANS